MTLTREEVKDRLYAAYHALLRHDRVLLDLDANERSITHKLAEYLQREFPDWNVDCEYNRDKDAPKRLPVQCISTDDTDDHTVFPDIIIHHRNIDDNLVVIEAKKSSTSAGGDDEEKLKAYVAKYHYQFAFAIVFPVGLLPSEVNPSTDITEVTA